MCSYPVVRWPYGFKVEQNSSEYIGPRRIRAKKETPDGLADRTITTCWTIMNEKGRARVLGKKEKKLQFVSFDGKERINHLFSVRWTKASIRTVFLCKSANKRRTWEYRHFRVSTSTRRIVRFRSFHLRRNFFWNYIGQRWRFSLIWFEARTIFDKWP